MRSTIFWLNNKLLSFHRTAFQRTVSSYFRFAYKYSPSYERSRVVSEMVTRLRKWAIGSETDPILDFLPQGKFTIPFGLESTSSKPITALPPLKGMQKLFSIRNEAGHRVIRLFTLKIASHKITLSRLNNLSANEQLY